MNQHKSKKIRAILAGGLVLGVGAAVTLAAWNDSEFATGTFTAGQFNLQGSDDGADYAEHPTTGDALELTFSGVFDNLAPGDTAHAPYWLRLDANSTTNGILKPNGVAASTAGTNAAAISYTISRVNTGSCGDGITDHPVVASGADLNKQTPGVEQNIPLKIGTAANTAGAAVQLCMAVTAGDEAQFKQGIPTTAVWQFAAVSGPTD